MEDNSQLKRMWVHEHISRLQPSQTLGNLMARVHTAAFPSPVPVLPRKVFSCLFLVSTVTLRVLMMSTHLHPSLWRTLGRLSFGPIGKP